MPLEEPVQRADADPDALPGKAGLDLGKRDVALGVSIRRRPPCLCR